MKQQLIRLFTASSVLAMALTACSSQSGPTQPEAQTSGISSQAQEILQKFEQQGQTDVQILDVGKGKRTGTAIAINFSYKEPTGFNTKISQPGWEGKTFADLNRFHVYLLECDSLLLPTPNLGAPPDLESGNGCFYKFDGHVNKIGGFSGNQIFIFDNVDENSPDSIEVWRYYVAVAAEDGSFLNITDPVSGFMIGGTFPSNGPVALSASGGDGSGGVKVQPGYLIATGEEPSLNVNMGLQSDQGAFIDSNVVVAPGATSYQGTVGVN